MLRRAAVLVGLLAVLLTPATPATAATPSPRPAPETVTLVLFWGDGCPRCAKEKEFLAELQDREPRLRIEQYEVWKDAANREHFERYAEQRGLTASAVPTTFVGDHVWVGYTGAIGRSIEQVVRDTLAGRAPPGRVTGDAGEGTCGLDDCPIPVEEDTTVDVPGIGTVDVGDKSLILSTLLIGALDGFNPCSLWVISILLAMVLRTGSRGRVIAVGSTFLLVTAALYGVYMAGLYTALTFIAVMGWIRVVVAGVAGTFGLVNMKDYFWFKRGLSLTIADSAKPGIYQRIRAITAGESLAAALGATVVLAVGVSLLETPCTAGFPVLWTSLLSANDVPPAEAALLFVLYMVPFLLDELAVFIAAVVTMRATKLQEQHGRLLKLVGGTVMLALAVVMLVDYELMNDVLSATLVFAGAIALALAVHATVGRLPRGAATG